MSEPVRKVNSVQKIVLQDRPTAMEVAGSLNAIELVDLMKGIVS